MRKHSVTLQGRCFELRSDASFEHMDRVAQRTEEAIEELRKAGASPQDAAILAALNLASDLLDAERRLGELKASLAQRLQTLEDATDKALGDAVEGGSVAAG